MSIEVDEDSLRQAAAALALLPSDIDAVPKLDAERAGSTLKGSAVGAALMGSNAASTRAKTQRRNRTHGFR